MTGSVVTNLDNELDRIRTGHYEAAELEAFLDDLCPCEGSSPPSVDISIDLRVACLLRLLAINVEAIYRSTHRRHILTFVEERLTETRSRILDQYQITSGTQADEFCRRLGRVTEDADEDLNNVLSSYTNLSGLRDFRQRFLQVINSFRCKVIVKPFLATHGDPTELLKQRLSSIIAYLDADVQDARLRYDDAKAMLRQTRAWFETSPTIVALPIRRVFDRINNDLTLHARSNPYLKPAALDIKADLRRYPLHESGLIITIPFELVNKGDGIAADVFLHWKGARGLKDLGEPIRLETLPPGSITVETTATTDPDNLEVNQGARCSFQIQWLNGDGTTDTRLVTCILSAQDPNVDWDRFAYNDPYSLDAVRTRAELVGRSTILNRIVGVMNTDTVGSLYIHGQKRVGKTSLAHVALKVLEEDHDFTSIFIDVGEILNPEPSRVIDNLTSRLADELYFHYPQYIAPDGVILDGTLVSLMTLLRRVDFRSSRLIIALDEFDWLPLALLQRTTEADTFFLGLRRLSSIPGIGVVLIGAERMQIILNGPGVQLNRFNGFRVDYIRRSTQWSEFCDLIQGPTRGSLHYTDGAMTRIYEYSNGNPYYTKLICGKLLESAARRRDAFIARRDVDRGIEELLDEIGSTSFSHYWEDFVIGDEQRRNEITTSRRRCLLAYGSVAARGSAVTQENIFDEASDLGLAPESTAMFLDEFIGRKILIKDGDDCYRANIRLFDRWIADRGQEQITFTMPEQESIRQAVLANRTNKVSLHEADELVRSWGTYRGRSISGDRLVEYLRQFGGDYEQRLIFSLLKELKFIGAADEDRLLQQAYDILSGQLKERYGGWSRSQIGITFVGPVAKSSNAMARSFARANRFIIKDDVFPRKDLRRRCEGGVTDIVIVDDFVGTGETLCEQLDDLARELSDEQSLYIFVLAAIDEALDKVEDNAIRLFGTRRVMTRSLISVSKFPWPFEEGVGDFGSVEMAEAAKELVKELGQRVAPKGPLGYGNCGVLIVFSHTIPNNTLPILWGSAAGSFTFNPLFPRH